jgi:two-component system chemotaxis response regulator CheB
MAALATPLANGRRIRVLVVDDSALVRRMVREALEAAGDIEVVGVAPDPFVAREKLLELSPDVMTLDVEMPKLDGISFLHAVMAHQPLPVIILSSVTQEGSERALEALAAGAVDVLAKPGASNSLGDMGAALVDRVRLAAQSKFRRRPARPAPPPARTGAAPVANVTPLRASPTPTPAPRLAETAAPSPGQAERSVSALIAQAAQRNAARAAAPRLPVLEVNARWAPDQLIALGASTGGTEALAQVLARLPANAPPVVLVQHIHAAFVGSFAHRLNGLCAGQVALAQDGEVLRPGQVRVAPGDQHLVVERGPEGLRTRLKGGPKVCHQRPAADVLFHSVAQAAGPRAVAALLTGMGSDGADGLAAMRRAGARTLAQDEATSVVWGMPGEAWQRGAAESLVALPDVAQALLERLKRVDAPGAGAPVLLGFSSRRGG